ncbi:MAG: tetratricopeptide repeat protein [Pyrinomonadaceae bacterium]
MSVRKQWKQAIFSTFIIWTLLAGSLPVKAQDIVTSEDISGGSSVFVFRQSRKAAQTKAAFRNNSVSRTDAQRREMRRKLFVQANTVAKTQRTRTKPVDPNTVAVNKTPRNNGGRKINQPARVSDEQNSLMAAGAAETYLDRNDFDKAVEDFKVALEFNPKNTNAKLGLSEAYTRQADDASEKNSPAAAIPLYLQAVQLNDKNAAAYAGLGDAYDAAKDGDKALTNYEKAISLNPNLTEIYAPLGILYYQKGEIAQADNYLSKASAANADDADARYYLGLVRFKQNNNDEAISALNQTVKVRPDSAEAHYYLGATYDRLDNRKPDAIAEYNKAVAINPNYVEAWFDMGVANYNQGNYEAAADDYNKVIKLKNDYGQAYYNLAETYRRLAMNSTVPATRAENFALANSKYEIAALTIKNDADLYSNWAYCLAHVAKFNLAIEKLNIAVSINPDAADYTNLGWAYYNAAQLDTRVKKDDAAAKSKLQLGKIALQKATELNPKYRAAFLNLGVTSTDLGDFQGAVAALKVAVELKEDWIPANNELGLAYRQLNDLENAVRYFKRATQLDDNFAPGWYNLGEAEYRRGNIKEAKKAQEKLKKLNAGGLSRDLDLIIKGAVLTNPANDVKNKVQQKNPINKLPKLPF